ncbi:MAG: hypothetical protein R2798_11215 [Chitinophagales bacterium]|nr:hypothetical protein [Bacteroidota bacterium]MCB9043224.1 hypothetical protein [Chitinophagales bacterium]
MDILTPGVHFSSTWGDLAAPIWVMSPALPTTTTWFPLPPGSYIPMGITAGKVNFCLNVDDISQVPQDLLINYISTDPAGNDSIVCIDSLRLDCLPPPDTCLVILNDTIICNSDGSYTYSYDVQNTSSHTANNILVHSFYTIPSGGGISFAPNPVNTTLPPGGIFSMPPITISSSAGSQFCYQISLYDNGDGHSNWCCHTDTICITLPPCEPTVCCEDEFNLINNGHFSKW